MKSGWKTTEFWVHLVVALLGIATTFGVITPEQSTTLQKAITEIIGAVMTIAPVVSYIISRGIAKKGK